MNTQPPVLALPPRYTGDSVALWRAAVGAGWDVERLHHWQVRSTLRDRDVKVYGESFFCRFVAEELGLCLVEPSLDWLPGLPCRFLRREVQALSATEVPGVPGPVFLKPADEKLFPATISLEGL